MGYSVQIPGSSLFIPLADGNAGNIGAPSVRLGATFHRFNGLAIGADDLGGSGVATVRYSLSGGGWTETRGPLALLGPLPDGQYSLRYQSLDGAGNPSEERSLEFRVDSSMAVFTTGLPVLRR
jgi:hypothetical protein